MQKLLTVLCVSAAIVMNGCSFSTSAEPSLTRSVEVSYHDLDSDARQEIECLANNIYFEARNEPHDGQYAVALVTLNRVKSDEFPDSICKVVEQRKRNTCQFSWFCESKLVRQYRAKQHNTEAYTVAMVIALTVYLNHDNIRDITHGATYYHAAYVSPNWKHLVVTTQIGQHIFYRI